MCLAEARLPQDFSLKTISLSATNSRNDLPADAKIIAQYDILATAIDFVLALEHRCMPHIPYQDPPSPDPANHMMMASTSLVARAPDPPQLNSTWTASGATIKALLNLSASINLEGEITPVEAWHRLYEHPDFWKLDRNQIERLKRELSREVRCCGYVASPPLPSHTQHLTPLPATGSHPSTAPADMFTRFGAVLDEIIFWDAVNRAFASSVIAS